MKRIPLFEVFVTFLSYSFSLVLWVNPELFNDGAAGYEKLSNLASESTYAVVFMLAATIKLIGLLFDIKWLRTVGLIASVLIYLALSILFFMDHSKFLPIVLGLLSLCCGLCIVTDVKNTKM